MFTDIKNNGKAILLQNYDINEINIDGAGVFVGEIGNCKKFLDVSKNSKNLFCFSHFKNYLCTRYYPYFGSLLFNQDYVFISLNELNRRPFHFFGNYAKDSTIFIRPDRSDKILNAQLLDFQDLKGFYNKNYEHRYELLVVTSPKKILGEWRFVCTKNKNIIGCSLYRYQELDTMIESVPDEAVDFCKQILSVGYVPDDIACDSAMNYGLLELTSFSSAGHYAINRKKIIESVDDMITSNIFI